MSLINKYEPKNLKDVLGNENAKVILEGFLSKKEVPQIYLFYGAFGCGKTLMANIISKQLNCGDNIYNINASNDRGIDSIRQIIESSKFKTLDGKNKAYILDEAHQLPVLSQEALLTTFQDPPKNTYFFLCTTEKNKLLPTIISRCKQIEVEKIAARDLYPYLIEISKKENNEINKNVARKIAETSKGHVRDSIQILESVIQFKDEVKQLEIAGKEIEENKQVIDLCRIMLKSDTGWNEIKVILKDLQKESPESLRKVIIAYMGKVLLDQGNIKCAMIIEALQNPIYDFPVLVMQIFSVFQK